MSAPAVRTAPAGARNGMPERRDYRYNGTGVDTLTPWMDDEDGPEPPAGPCHCDGRMGAYRRHIADGEEPCRASRDAVNAYHRDRRRAKRGLA